MNLTDYSWYMNLAYEQAEKAYRVDEVPIGAIIVTKDGEVLSAAHNLKEKTYNPCGHAEILAITKASERIKNWRLEDCTLFVTLEPCTMCLAAMVQARIAKVVFGAYDLKGGALSLNYQLNNDKRLNHRFSVLGGVEHYKCSSILSTFFREKRKSYKVK